MRLGFLAWANESIIKSVEAGFVLEIILPATRRAGC
jgi:hypothetical protein